MTKQTMWIKELKPQPRHKFINRITIQSII